MRDAAVGTTDVYDRAGSCEPLGASKAQHGQGMAQPHPQSCIPAHPHCCVLHEQVKQARDDVPGVKRGMSCRFTDWQGGGRDFGVEHSTVCTLGEEACLRW